MIDDLDGGALLEGPAGGPGYFTHHTLPLGYGGDAGDALDPPPVLSINRAALRRPANPGLPPLYHIPLPAPEAYRLPFPPAFAAPPTRHDARLPTERPAFPVAEPPGFRPLAAGGSTGGLADASAAAPASPAGVAARAGTAPAGAAQQPVAPARRFDPVYPFLLFLALEIGTFYIHLEPVVRYTLLWTVLAALGAGLMLIDPRNRARVMASAGLGWGVSFGLVFSLPLFILVGSGLASMVSALYPEIGPATLFQSLVFVGPLGETLFFRGVLQERRGLVAAVLGAGVSGLIFYWPAASQAPLYLAAAGLFTTVLAGVYSFIRTRYGLAAAYVCQVTVNLLLLFVPSLLFA